MRCFVAALGRLDGHRRRRAFMRDGTCPHADWPDRPRRTLLDQAPAVSVAPGGARCRPAIRGGAWKTARGAAARLASEAARRAPKTDSRDCPSPGLHARVQVWDELSSVRRHGQFSRDSGGEAAGRRTAGRHRAPPGATWAQRHLVPRLRGDDGKGCREDGQRGTHRAQAYLRGCPFPAGSPS